MHEKLLCKINYTIYFSLDPLRIHVWPRLTWDEVSFEWKVGSFSRRRSEIDDFEDETSKPISLTVDWISIPPRAEGEERYVLGDRT